MRRSRLHEQQQQRTQRAEVLAAAQMQRRAQLMRVSDVDSSSNANARLQQRPSSAAGAVPSHTNKSAVQAPVAAHTTAELTATAHAVNPLTASNSSSTGISRCEPHAQAAASTATDASTTSGPCDKQLVVTPAASAAAAAVEVSSSAQSDNDASDFSGDSIDADVLMQIADNMSEHDETAITAAGSVQQPQHTDTMQEDNSAVSTPVQQPVWSVPSTPTVTHTATVAASAGSSTQANDSDHSVNNSSSSTSHKAHQLSRRADTGASTGTIVTEAMVVLLREVLSAAAAASKVHLGDKTLEVAYTELDKAGHSAAAVLRQHFSANKIVKVFAQIETLLKRYGTSHEGQASSWYTIGGSGIVYAADSVTVIDTAALLASADATDQSSNTTTSTAVATGLTSSGCAVAVDEFFLTVVHDIQLKIGLLNHQLDTLKSIHRDISRLASNKVGRFRRVHDNSIDKDSLIYTVHNKEVFIYDMPALYKSKRIQDKLKYCYLTGLYEQPYSMDDVHAMISTEWPDDIDELMKQAQTVAAANLAVITNTKDKLTALKELYSSSSSISRAQCTAVRQKFASQEQAELDETASFGLHKDYLVCEIVPLLIRASSSSYKANGYYKQLLEQPATATKSNKQSRTGGSSSSSSSKSDNSNMPTAISNSRHDVGTSSNAAATATTASTAAGRSADKACDTAAVSAVHSNADDTHAVSATAATASGARTATISTAGSSGSGKRKAHAVAGRDRTSVLSSARHRKVTRTQHSSAASAASAATATAAAAAAASADSRSDPTTSTGGTVYDFDYRE
eukprot:9347-Heterococcus_DN1.PRE.1